MRPLFAPFSRPRCKARSAASVPSTSASRVVRTRTPAGRGPSIAMRVGVYMATEEGKKEPTATKQGTIVVQSGQPLQFTGVVDASSPSAGAAAVAASVGAALAAYMK